MDHDICLNITSLRSINVIEFIATDYDITVVSSVIRVDVAEIKNFRQRLIRPQQCLSNINNYSFIDEMSYCRPLPRYLQYTDTSKTYNDKRYDSDNIALT